MKDYSDIIELPHHISKTRPRMSQHDRAAQFSPFAALNGYEDVIEETARTTDTRTELSESEQELINRKLVMLSENTAVKNRLEAPNIKVTYFVPDKRKQGGSYATAVGAVRRIDEYEKNIVFTDGKKIPIAVIRDIETITYSNDQWQYD